VRSLQHRSGKALNGQQSGVQAAGSDEALAEIKTLLTVTDAWYPQVNGVVRSIERVSDVLNTRGVQTELITPLEYKTFPMPGYDEIALSRTTSASVALRIQKLNPDSIHIATEGPLGLWARNYCVRNKLPFSTAYHTQFPEYARARWPVPLAVSYAYLRWFHGPARYCLVGTETIAQRLRDHGFTNTAIWQKGVDTALFHPDRAATNPADFPYTRPTFLFVGRVAVEKNIEAFLKLDLPGTKVVVGDGPERHHLEKKYPAAVFLGSRQGEDLARLFASADVFVFPSRTDTFGLVLLEALSSGTPVAAYPVPGPLDVIGDADIAVLSEDLQGAAIAALKIPRHRCRAYAQRFSWEASADQFLAHLPAIPR
jgi:glycosyltransferase involved in cell wall biosynthesis